MVAVYYATLAVVILIFYTKKISSNRWIYWVPMETNSPTVSIAKKIVQNRVENKTTTSFQQNTNLLWLLYCGTWFI